MKGNFQVRFLGEGVAVMPLPYPTTSVAMLWNADKSPSLETGFPCAAVAA